MTTAGMLDQGDAAGYEQFAEQCRRMARAADVIAEQEDEPARRYLETFALHVRAAATWCSMTADWVREHRRENKQE